MIIESVIGVFNYAKEIIIINTGLPRDVRKLLSKFGAIIYDYDEEFDFSNARNKAIDEASSDWILFLDTDEIISGNEINKILLIIGDEKNKKYAYALYQTNYFCNGLWSAYPITRLFPKKAFIKFEKIIHETPNYSIYRNGMEVKITDIRIDHFGYINPRQKNEHYKSLLEKQISLTPNDNATWWHYAFSIAPKSLSEAIKIMRHAVNLDENSILAHIHLSRLLLYNNEFIEAEEEINNSIKIDKMNYWNASTYNLKGLIQLGKEKINDAIECFSIALSNSKLPHILCNLGVAYELSNNEELSINAFISAIKCNPLLINIPRNEENNYFNFYQDVTQKFLSIKNYLQLEPIYNPYFDPTVFYDTNR